MIHNGHPPLWRSSIHTPHHHEPFMTSFPLPTRALHHQNSTLTTISYQRPSTLTTIGLSSSAFHHEPSSVFFYYGHHGHYQSPSISLSHGSPHNHHRPFIVGPLPWALWPPYTWSITAVRQLREQTSLQWLPYQVFPTKTTLQSPFQPNFYRTSQSIKYGLAIFSRFPGKPLYPAVSQSFFFFSQLFISTSTSSNH